MAELKAGLPQSFLSGSGTADFTLGIGAGAPPQLSASSDLVGVTLAIPELGWRKPASTSGTLTADATLGDGLKVDALNLQAAGLRTAASITFRQGEFDRVSFSSFDLGNWLAVPAELIGRGNAAPDIRVLGGVLNLGRATFGGSEGGGSGSGAGPNLDVTLDRLQVTEGVALTGFKGTFHTTGGVNGTFNARVNGGAAMQGRLTPRGARSAVELTSNDAGAVLRSAGLLTQARGGTLDVQLEPVAAAGSYDVILSIVSTRIQDAPAMAALAERGVEFSHVTLHVGAGTFLPVKVEDVTTHKMHAEWGRVSQQAADEIRATKAAGGRVIPVGTTALRLIESAARSGQIAPWEGETDIFIYPGFQFHVTDALMTNFHLPKSTLLMLVSALMGQERMRSVYAHAIEQKYRFFSYGDSSLLIP
jgi:hypothetical protein